MLTLIRLISMSFIILPTDPRPGLALFPTRSDPLLRCLPPRGARRPSPTGTSRADIWCIPTQAASLRLL